MSAKENQYQRDLMKQISRIFPGCLILKNDPNYIQGIPDLLVLYGDKWAMLEVKAHAKAPHRPNQALYVTRLNHMGFSRFVYPENEEEVLRDLNLYFNQA